MMTLNRLKLQCTLPKGAGEIYKLMQCKGAMVATCEGGVYVIKGGRAELFKPDSGPAHAYIDHYGVITDKPTS